MGVEPTQAIVVPIMNGWLLLYGSRMESKHFTHERGNTMGTSTQTLVVVNSYCESQIGDHGRVSGNSFFDGTVPDLSALATGLLADATIPAWGSISTPAHDSVAYLDPNGVMHLSIPAETLMEYPRPFYTGVRQLHEGDEVVFRFEARQEGEAPCLHPVTLLPSSNNILPRATKARSVTLLCYPSILLEKERKNELAAQEGNYEIVSINASPELEETPIGMTALCRNHFKRAGGTFDELTPEQFEEVVEEADRYWRDKVVGCVVKPDTLGIDEIDVHNAKVLHQQWQAADDLDNDVRGDTKVIDYDDLDNDDTNA